MLAGQNTNKLSVTKRRWVKVISTGLILSLAVLILEFLLFFTCKDNLLCLGLLIIPTLPGVILLRILNLEIEKYYLVFFNLVIWFLIGSIIGFLIFKTKLKKNLNNKSKKPIKNKNN